MVVLIGRGVMALSQSGFAIVEHSLLRSLLSLPTYLCGLTLVVAGIVGVLYRTLADTTVAGG